MYRGNRTQETEVTGGADIPQKRSVNIGIPPSIPEDLRWLLLVSWQRRPANRRSWPRAEGTRTLRGGP